ncbi:DUF418 domain-containing protein [Thalassotalea ganghwensis]
MNETQTSQEVNSSSVSALKPISASKRIDALDILRGIALIGILLMNIEWFNRPIAALSSFDESLSGVDHAVGWLIRCFVEGKFYKLFALLFGMGFAVMLMRAKEVGRPFGAWFSRRMIALWVIGIAHMIFLWGGDILHDYALAGMFLLLWVYLLQKPRFQKFDNPRSYLKLSLIWLSIPLLFATLAGIGAGSYFDAEKAKSSWQEQQEIAALVAERMLTPSKSLTLSVDVVTESEEPVINESDSPEQEELSDEQRKEQAVEDRVKSKREQEQRKQKEITAFTQDSYWQATKFRLEFVAEMVPFSPIFSLMMLVPLFILGFWFVASKRITHYQEHIPMYKAMMRIGLPLGLFLNVAGLILLQQPVTKVAMAVQGTGQMIFLLGQYTLTAGYIGLIVCLLAKSNWQKRLAHFAPMGKMALTNYIMHSVILTSIFYGYAGGQFGEIARGGQMLIVIGIVVFQVIFSKWWLAHYRFGPLEWLWRSITYKKIQSMRLPS